MLKWRIRVCYCRFKHREKIRSHHLTMNLSEINPTWLSRGGAWRALSKWKTNPDVYIEDRRIVCIGLGQLRRHGNTMTGFPQRSVTDGVVFQIGSNFQVVSHTYRQSRWRKTWREDTREDLRCQVMNWRRLLCTNTIIYCDSPSEASSSF